MWGQPPSAVRRAPVRLVLTALISQPDEQRTESER